MKNEQSPDVQKKLAESLTAQSTDLLPFLAFLLQDIYELGGSPEDAAELLAAVPHEGMRVLDLCCGKGAVAVELAKRLGVAVKGIDLIPEFIVTARQKAKEAGVEALCTFEVGDVNEAVEKERGWDCAVFSAAGDVLGSPAETLAKLAATLRPGGYILLDDSYRPEDVPAGDILYKPGAYITEGEWLALFKELGLREVARRVADNAEAAEYGAEQVRAITFRCQMMAALHPEKRDLFEGYAKSQADEVADIEDHLVNLTWLLRKD